MAVIATGQFTILDHTDALTLSGYISSNHPRTQIYNPDNGVYTPDWSYTFLTLEPFLFRMGVDNGNLITSKNVIDVKWYESGSNTPIDNNTIYNLSGSKLHILKVKTNILSATSSKDWDCEITYRDETTNLDLKHRISIGFSKIINGGGIADAVAFAPEGNVFKNGAVTNLKAKCQLWRGSVIDNTDVTYQWYQQNTSITTDQGGGIGWKKLTETPNRTTGVTTDTMTVFADAVDSYAVFKCIIKDTDSSSNTYNKTFMDTISFMDNSDPIQISILSSGGDVFKNGVGSTTLTARVFQAGAEIDKDGRKYVYRWYKYNKDGTLVTNFGGTNVSFKTGKTLTIGDADVDIKATFSVEID